MATFSSRVQVLPLLPGVTSPFSVEPEQAHGVQSLSLQGAQRPSRRLVDLIVNDALDRGGQKVLG